MTNLFLHGTHIVSAPSPKKVWSLYPSPLGLSAQKSHQKMGQNGSKMVTTFRLSAHSFVHPYKIITSFGLSLTNRSLHCTHIASARFPKKSGSLKPYPSMLSLHQPHHMIGNAGSKMDTTFTLSAHSGLTQEYDPSARMCPFGFVSFTQFLHKCLE